MIVERTSGAEQPMHTGVSPQVIVTEAEFVASVLTNPFNRELLVRLRKMNLPDCHLTGGCMFQTVWNVMSGRAPTWGIKDYDVFYFDDRDLSWQREDRVVQDVAALVADLPVVVEVRNQARVHLWYQAKFGGAYPRLSSARDGIDRYLISGTCVGMRSTDGELYRPNGLEDLLTGTLRMNPLNPKPRLFRQKSESYIKRWAWLRMTD